MFNTDIYLKKRRKEIAKELFGKTYIFLNSDNKKIVDEQIKKIDGVSFENDFQGFNKKFIDQLEKDGTIYKK